MKTLDERKKLWNQLDDAARKLGVPSLPKLHVGMLVEKDGFVLANQREEGHSWTRNGWNWAFARMTDCSGDSLATFGAGYMSAKRDNGGIYHSSSYRASCNTQAGEGMIGAAGYNDRGIAVGTDDTAFSADQYILVSKIAHGNAAGQLYYMAQTWPTLDYTGTIWTATHKRVLNNNSGDTITIKEVGLYSVVDYFTTSGYSFLLARDVLASPVSVANGAQLTVTYEISMDFAAIDS